MVTVQCPQCGDVPEPVPDWVCERATDDDLEPEQKCSHNWNEVCSKPPGTCPKCKGEWSDTTCKKCGKWSNHLAWYVAEEKES